MKRLFGCFKGEGSGTAVQEPQQPQLSVCSTFFSGPFPSSPPLPDNCPESFPWQAIVDGTKNFRRTKSLGQGTFSEVFRCEFPSINMVGAAKIQNSTSQACHLELINEITMLQEADHPNVIKLLGMCYEPTHRALVYDFMPHGSLDHYLIDEISEYSRPDSPWKLDWGKRMRIAVGVARGLDYVHKTLKVILQDMKAESILLDLNFEPKLSNLGSATRIVEGGYEQESTISDLKITWGSISPETRLYGKVSTKSDVYSYGVFLLQRFTGKKAYDYERPFKTRHLADWFLSARKKNRDVVLDVTLWSQSHSAEGFRKVLDIAWKCVGTDPHSRPNMDVVESMILEAAACPISEDSIESSLA